MEIPLPLFSIIISSLAICIAGLTAWLTFFRNGKLLMTKPTVIFFGPDGLDFSSNKNKIYLRTLLYCTAKRGHVVESLHISLHRNESKQNFNIWVYGNNGNLERGSGLFVPQEGITYDHHFLLPEDGANFNFLPGAYNLRVFANIVGKQGSRELCSINLTVTEPLANQLSKPNTGIYFDWSPDQQNYHPHSRTKPEIDFNDLPFMKKLLETKNELSEKTESK
jgi:hypothetical protein